MNLHRLPLVLLAGCFAVSSVMAGCAGKKTDVTADGSVDDGTTDPTGGDFDPDPAAGDASTGGPSSEGDATVGDAGAPILVDGAVFDASFPDASPDGGAPFCTKGYEDLVKGKPGPGGAGQVVVKLSPDDKPKEPDPQCFRVRKGQLVRFDGDLKANPVVVLTPKGAVQVALDPNRDDRGSYVFADEGSFYFATVKHPDVERGHVVVVP